MGGFCARMGKAEWGKLHPLQLYMYVHLINACNQVLVSHNTKTN